jgi:phosphatidylglycerol---prolipoprotein diacylglyceryl transferase
MLPAIPLGPFFLSSYALIYGVAIVLAGMLAFRRLLALEVPAAWIVEGFGATMLAGALGAAFGYAVIRAAFGLGPDGAPRRLALGGSSIFGALVVGGIAGLAYCHWRRMPLGTTFDLGIPALPLGQAIGRLGCLAAGCCYGKPAASWIGMYLPGAGGVWTVRYPTQLISSAADLAIFLLLLGVERAGAARAGARGRWPFPGFLTLTYGALYASKRFLVEFLRGDTEVVLGPLTWPQVLALAGLVLVLALLAGNAARARRVRGARA